VSGAELDKAVCRYSVLYYNGLESVCQFLKAFLVLTRAKQFARLGFTQEKPPI